TLAEGLDHPEGVAAGPDGTLYTGGEAGQIYRVAEDGSFEEVASTDGFIYGVTVAGTGDVFACDFGNAAVARVSATTGEVETYSKGTAGRPMRVPNFAAFDDGGNLYVTDSGEWGQEDGLVYRIAPGGFTEVWTEATPRFPNGCCLTADGEALLVVESHGRAVVRVPIGDDGGAGPPELVVDLSGSQPDGIALAEDGTMFVGCYRPDRIYRISPGGPVEVFAEDPDGVVLNQPANVAFSGPNLDRLVVSSLGGWSLVAAPAGARGLPLRYPSV
ncbi:MAG TPA: SMP-30/gluconolactonase/LRE family protein, partial [Actinomycetota bacterium]|nr:SMP-30/gluconolactonase/LRE family protein [Actinomycetota bacterium]